MDHVIVFLGPTLPQEAARRILKADYRAPASQGDLCRAGLEWPDCILLIDGLFAVQPTVLHKEIMWVLAKGIPVLGAASLGALRAAELHEAGMQGIGRVFADYQEGRIEDDDEVAVQHGPGELGWMPVSTAMIDIRYCLGQACAEEIITPALHRLALSVAKQTYFPARNYRDLLRRLAERGQAPHEIAALRDWLGLYAFSQKQRDAVEVLEFLRAGRPVLSGETHAAFPATTYWHHHLQRILATSPVAQRQVSETAGDSRA
jgi:hypothetical protein